MNDTKVLKEKILDLAVRGKLIPQDPNDEPASVLLERIHEQKKQMVKEGKLKPKDIKNDTYIFKGDDNLHYEQFQDGTIKCIEDEIPFEIPDNWAWSRLTCVLDVRDGTHDTPQYVAVGVPLITSKNLCESGLNYTDVKYISYEDANLINQRSKVDVGDILYAMIGTIGNPTIVDKDFLCSIKNVALFKFTYSNDFNREYIKMFFQLSQESMKSKANGGLQPFISLNYLRNYLVPIPPITEQNKIADYFIHINILIEKIEANKNCLETLAKSTKSKILDLAIRGKLVPQDPNDEPASVLLGRIRAEKEELIKQGKIKRDKKESIIFKGDDNSYYCNFPSNWVITTLHEITTSQTLNDGDWILSENMCSQGEVKLIQLGSIGNMIYLEKGFKFLTKQTFNKLSCVEIFPGYLLINRILNNKMCCCIIPDIKGTLITTVDTCWIAPSLNTYNIRFLMYAISSPIFQHLVLMRASGTTRKRISKNNLISIPLSFPPLAEQHRIVNKIETIFNHLNNIANNIL